MPAQVHTCWRTANDRVDDPEEERGMDLWSDKTKIDIFAINWNNRKSVDEYSPQNSISVVKKEIDTYHFRSAFLHRFKMK